MSDKVMTLKERFDDHMYKAAVYENDAVNSFAMGDTYLVGIYMQRGQLHATLALAVAQRMTADGQAQMADIAESLSALAQFKYYGI